MANNHHKLVKESNGIRVILKVSSKTHVLVGSVAPTLTTYNVLRSVRLSGVRFPNISKLKRRR